MNLSPDAWLLIEGLCADYQRRMLLDLRRGGLTPEGEARYLRDVATAQEILDAVRAREAA